MTEATCPNCSHHFRLPKPHGTSERWTPSRPKPSAVKVLRALRSLGAVSESTAVPRKRIAMWLLGNLPPEDGMKSQNITSRASELVAPGLAEVVDGEIQENVAGVLKWRRRPLWYILPAGLAYLERGEQAPLVGAEA